MKVRSDSVCLFTRHSNLTFNLRGALRADNKCDPQTPASSGPAVATRGGLVAEISSAECCYWTLHWPLPLAISFIRYRVGAKLSTKIQHKIIGWWPPPSWFLALIIVENWRMNITRVNRRWPVSTVLATSQSSPHTLAPLAAGLTAHHRGHLTRCSWQCDPSAKCQMRTTWRLQG